MFEDEDTIKRARRTSLVIISEEMEDFVQRAKTNYPTYNLNEKWIQYTRRISSSNPFKTITSLWVIIPALSQIIQMFSIKYNILDCYQSDAHGESLDGNNMLLGLGKCIAYNRDTIAFDQSTCDEHVTYGVQEFQLCVAMCFLVYYVLIFSIFRETKFSLKLLSINVKMTKIINPFHWMLFGAVTVLLLAAGYMRYEVQEAECTMGVGKTAKIYITFMLSLSRNNAILAAIQMIMTFSCFYSLFVKHYKDPWLSYTSLRSLLIEAESANFNISKIDYTIEDRRALVLIQAYFKKFKQTEDETIILLAAFEDLKKRGMIINNKKKVDIESQSTIEYTL